MRHRDIHQDHVDADDLLAPRVGRTGLAHLADRLGAVVGLSGDHDVAGVGQDLLDALAHDQVVVADQHADHGAPFTKAV